jgi:competence protein ComFC
MKCLLCGKYSFFHICANCQKLYLAPSIYKRKVLDIDVISFYKYSNIKDLIHTKHTDIGYYIYNILAKNSFLKFASEFRFDQNIASISIDDKVKDSYSHTAILNRYLKNNSITPYYSKLVAKNNISYSGKSKQFRLTNPRYFIYKPIKEKYIILVDDIITTGTTLAEAITKLKQFEKEVLFCLVLADAKE